MSSIWDSLTIFWTPSRVTSLALPSATHTACLLGSGWLHSTAVADFGGHPMVLASPKCWVFCYNWAAHSPLLGSLHGAKPQLLCMTLSVLSLQLLLWLHLHQWPLLASPGVKPQLLSMAPSCLQNQYHQGDSYTTTQLLCANSQETLPEDFTSVMLVSS